MSKCTLQLAVWDSKDTLNERGTNVIGWGKAIKSLIRQHCLKRTAEGMDMVPATKPTVPAVIADSWIPATVPGAPIIHHDAVFLEKRKAKAYDKFDQEVEDRAAQDEVLFQFLFKTISEAAKNNLELRSPTEYLDIVEAPEKDKWVELWDLVQTNFYLNPRGTSDEEGSRVADEEGTAAEDSQPQAREELHSRVLRANSRPHQDVQSGQRRL